MIKTIHNLGRGAKMEIVQGKHFSITDPKGINTVIYQINKTEKEYLKEFPKYTVERLDFTAEIRGDSTRKTYFVDEPLPDGNQLVILSFRKRKSCNKYGNFTWR